VYLVFNRVRSVVCSDTYNEFIRLVVAFSDSNTKIDDLVYGVLALVCYTYGTGATHIKVDTFLATLALYSLDRGFGSEGLLSPFASQCRTIPMSTAFVWNLERHEP
jgi:hypothetical protein